MRSITISAIGIIHYFIMKQLFIFILLFTFFNSHAQLDTSSNKKSYLPTRLTIAKLKALKNQEGDRISWCYTDTDLVEKKEIVSVPEKKPAPLIDSDIPGVNICNLLWMDKNLDAARYRNGDPIPHVKDPVLWSKLTTGAYCYYENDSAKYAATYGKLYNWYAVNDPRGLAPPGWHIPEIEEWINLESCLTGPDGVGAGLKQSGTITWTSPNSGATNSSGFKGLPGGFRDFNGTFYFVKNYGFWWSSTEYYDSFALGRNLYYFGVLFGRDGYKKQNAFSVRCVRD